ncbi:hypothetical protein C8J57DRAFT_1706330 [Mycena rebaudengoi]|nr:hypothetical protein C8J57DRAFT_1706330 [Mycena rebaudengoi]
MVLVTYAAIILIASWVNLSLYALEIGLATEYFRRSSRPQLHKLGVVTFLLFDTICTTAILVEAFFLAIVAPCVSPQEYSKESLTAGVLIMISTYATASVCEIYLISLHYHLTKNRILTAFLMILVVVHLAFSYASTGLLNWEDASYTSDIAFKFGAVGASTTAGTDVLIALFLCYKLIRMDEASVAGGSATSLIRRIIVIIITSGLIVATTTLVILILLIKNHVAFPMFFFCQGRAYSLTILANFLFGIPRGPLITEADISRRAENVRSAVVFRLETDEDPSPTASEALEMLTKAAGHPNSLNSDPTHVNRRSIISLEEIPRVDVKSRPDD